MIRLAAEIDFNRILDIYSIARSYMKATGNGTQWGDTKPEKSTIKEYIAKKQLYVIEADNTILAVFALVPGKDPTYTYIENGHWLNDEEYVTLHAVASLGKSKGMFRMISEFAKSISDNVRIDTHDNNATMQHCILKEGYQYCGIINLADGNPRKAYQWSRQEGYMSDNIMKEYKFYGWKTADVPAVNEEYKEITNPRHLYDLLSDIWCADTCAPRMRDDWSGDNMTLGQCSITAFLAQDIFGGDVYGILRSGGNYHCYNVIGDCIFDLTSEQFQDEVLSYEDNPIQLREVHFAKEEKRLRYEYLKEELKKAIIK